MRLRAVAVAAATLLILPVTACAPDPGDGAASDLPKQDITRWVMPLDQFASPATMALAGYASNLLVAECLSEEGVEWPIPWQSPDEASYLAPTANMSGFPHLTVEVAREHGYRAPYAPGGMGAPTPEETEHRKKFLAIAASTPGFEPLIDACVEEARETFRDDKASAFSPLNGWVWSAYESAARTDAVKEAAERWQSCLRDSGYPVDLAAPIDPQADEVMPSRALLEQLGISPRWQAGDGAPENPLTQGEIDLAVADATCRDSSGWNGATYRATWDAQVALLEKHAEELVRMRDEGEALLAEALEIIADHAPEK